MIIAFIQAIPAPPNAPPSLDWVWWTIGILVVAALSLIVVLSKAREYITVTSEKRAIAAEGLVKTRDLEIVDLNKLVLKLTQEKEGLESENRILAGVKIAELAKFWSEKDTFETQYDKMESDLRRTRNLLRQYEEPKV